MELRLRKLQDIYVIDVIGELDIYSTSKLKDLFMKMISRNVSRIIINMDGVHYLDSSGIGTLINMYAAAQDKHTIFCLSNVHSAAKKVIDLTRLTSHFPIEETIEAAIKYVNS